jgi:hypothetical protein
MAPVKFNIREKGVNKAVDKLRAVGDAAIHQNATMDDLARDAPSAISRVPIDTGRLDDSLKDGAEEQYKTVTDNGYDIGTTVPYSRYVFRGTQYMTARKPRIARKRLRDAAAGAVAADIIRAETVRGGKFKFFKR